MRQIEDPTMLQSEHSSQKQLELFNQAMLTTVAHTHNEWVGRGLWNAPRHGKAAVAVAVVVAEAMLSVMVARTGSCSSSNGSFKERKCPRPARSR